MLRTTLRFAAPLLFVVLSAATATAQVDIHPTTGNTVNPGETIYIDNNGSTNATVSVISDAGAVGNSVTVLAPGGGHLDIPVPNDPGKKIVVTTLDGAGNVQTRTFTINGPVEVPPGEDFAPLWTTPLE